jgi:sterol 3beta-glucosyltransferase
MARRISILTVGTLGDVAPMVVLGRALADQGYAVSVAAPDNFRHLIEGMGLEARRCGSDFSTLMKDEEVGSLTGARTLMQLLAWRFPGPKVRAMFEGVLRDAVAASADADAIIFHPYISIASDIAEARRIPAILVPLGLISPSAETPLAVLPRPTSPTWNRISYSLIYLQRHAYQSTIYDIRRQSLGLGRGFRYKHPHKVRGQRVTAIYPVSPVLTPYANGVDADVHFTGYWFRDDEPRWQPSPRLAEFLSGTPRPIYIGFGSMPYIGRERTEMLLAACEAAGQRAVLGKGWGAFCDSGETSLSENFRVLGYAPHLSLFRDVSAVVHHGGLGTTSAGLMAGRPTLVCPFLVDQPYWGHRVAQLGAGPEPLPIAEWTFERLTAAIRDLASNPLYRTRAAEIGAEMRDEGGQVAAARIVRSIVGAPELAPLEALLGTD